MQKFILPLLLLFGIASCKNESCQEVAQTQKKIMGEWYMKKINIPRTLRLINPGDNTTNFDLYNPVSGKHYLLEYFDASCDKCMNNVKRSNALLDSIKHELKDVMFVFIATGTTDAYVKKAIKEVGFHYPVYFEADYMKFKTINNLKEDQSAYNTMLLDDQYRVLQFGAFYDNVEAFKLYKSIINCM